MNVFDIISYLCSKKKLSVTVLCKEITGSSGNLTTWKKGNLKAKNLCALADYFGVTTDQLLGRAPLLNNNMGKEVRKLEKDQTQLLEECLLAFVERVSKGGATTESEVQVLPAVAQVLLNLGTSSTQVNLDAKAVAKAIHDKLPTCFVKEED